MMIILLGLEFWNAPALYIILILKCCSEVLWKVFKFQHSNFKLKYIYLIDLYR